MQLMKRELRIDFVGQAKFWIIVSSTLLLISFISFFTRGFNYGIDFSGGTAIQIKFNEKAKANSDRLRDALTDIDMQSASVQEYGPKENHEFLVKAAQSHTQIENLKDDFIKAINAELGSSNKVENMRFAPDKIYITLEKLDESQKIFKAISGVKLSNLDLKSVDGYGKSSNREYLAEFSGVTQIISNALSKVFESGNFDIVKVDVVGPKVGGELRRDALLAIFLALFFILIYTWLRFEIEFAPGAVICLLHDAIITAGVFSVFQLEVDTTFVAIILTIIGYSINDTIVIYDRIRENMRLRKTETFASIINLSINQTMSRTIITSLTVLFTTLAILIFGGPVLFNMALAFTIGLVIGSYSTIFIASPLTLLIHNKFFLKQAI